jgi:hydroxyethylthiazole kinase-like uncharacterized protein yjeF
MEVLDAERMQAADKKTIEKWKIPGILLMENAGRATAETIVEEFGELGLRHALVLAGPGQNGGDGFVVARHLTHFGIPCHVYMIGARRADLRGDAATMADIWAAAGGSLIEAVDTTDWKRIGPTMSAYDLIVDAMFGTGLNRPLEGLVAQVVEAVNESKAKVVAVDIPSGLFASCSSVPGPAIRAHATVTFARPKIAHLVEPADVLCGTIHVVDIGIPDRAIEETDPDVFWMTPKDARGLVPSRPQRAHKGTFGHVLVCGGSVGRAGAAGLASLAALTAGAGLVTAAVPDVVRAETAAVAPEIMTAALASTADGAIAESAVDLLLALSLDRSCLAIGPGIGTSKETVAAVRRIVAECSKTVILDADGLNAFAGELSDLRVHKGSLILTPHPGEAARLLGCSIADVQADRIAAVRRLSIETGAIACLKGFRTLVAEPAGNVYINSTGNVALAKGGSGDVLTGIIAALIAQGSTPLDAARFGVVWHGEAADIVAGKGRAAEHTTIARGVIAALEPALQMILDG